MPASPAPITLPRLPRLRTWVPAERNGAQMMVDTLAAWRAMGPRPDLWVFGYASLVWRPEFEAAETRLARVHGHHRCLQMWSRVNRGTPERPGLVFALMRGGSVPNTLPIPCPSARLPSSTGSCTTWWTTRSAGITSGGRKTDDRSSSPTRKSFCKFFTT